MSRFAISDMNVALRKIPLPQTGVHLHCQRAGREQRVGVCFGSNAPRADDRDICPDRISNGQ
jgi:hypothetical protein